MGFVSEKQTYYIVDRLKDILNSYQLFTEKSEYKELSDDDKELIGLTKDLLAIQSGIISKELEQIAPLEVLCDETYFDVEKSIFNAYQRLTKVLIFGKILKRGNVE